MGDVWATDPGLIKWKGVPLELKLSDESSTGYLNVCKKPTKTKGVKFYAKFKPPGEKLQRTLPGSCFGTAKEAAAELAYYLAGHRPDLREKEVRAARRKPEVRASPCILGEARRGAHPCTCAWQEIVSDNLQKMAARMRKKAEAAERRAAALAIKGAKGGAVTTA